MGGIETYVRRLYPAILEARPDLRVSVFVNEHGRDLLLGEDWAGDVELVTHRFLGRRGTRAITETALLGPVADRRGCDIVHSVALTAPFRVRATNVVTIADVTWLRERGSVPLHTRLLWSGLVTPVARRADRIITLSRAARTEISEDLRVPETQIDVVPLGPGAESSAVPTDERELRSRLGLGDGPIVLAVSALLAHKNVGALVEALPEIRKAVPDAVLVVPGNRTPLADQLSDRAAHPRPEGRSDPSRVGEPGRPRRALCRCRLLCLPLAPRGLRPAGARGDAPRSCRSRARTGRQFRRLPAMPRSPSTPAVRARSPVR